MHLILFSLGAIIFIISPLYTLITLFFYVGPNIEKYIKAKFNIKDENLATFLISFILTTIIFATLMKSLLTFIHMSITFISQWSQPLN